MDDYKKKQKASEITEDDLKGIEKDIQNLTDKFCKEIDELADTLNYLEKFYILVNKHIILFHPRAFIA